MLGLKPGMVEQFNGNLRHILQQEGTLLQKCVRTEMMDHEAVHFTTLGTAEALDRVPHADNGYDVANTVAARTIPMQRRLLKAHMVYWNATLDRGDSLNLITDPKSHYTKAAAHAMGRKIDKKIIAALGAQVSGTRLNLVGNAIEQNYPFLGRNIVPIGTAVAIGAVANNGNDLDELNAPVTSVIMAGADVDTQNANRRLSRLTVEKLIAARQKLKRAYPSSQEKFYLLCTVEQVSDLLEDERVNDFQKNIIRTLVAGEITYYMGFNFIFTDLLPAKIGLAAGALGNLEPLYTFRDCYAFAESAMIFGKVKGASLTRIDEDREHHYAHSIYVADSIGAVRMEDRGVVAIKCATRYDAADHSMLPLLAANAANAAACNVAVRALFV